MNLKRIAPACSILICMGGCSNLLTAPTHYSSLPVAPSVAGVPDADVAPVDVPGRLLISRSRKHGGYVEPLAALQRSSSARLGWEEPRSNREAGRAQGRYKAIPVAEPSSTASLSEAHKSNARGLGGSGTYNRETTMNRLVKGGKDAARPICNGC